MAEMLLSAEQVRPPLPMTEWENACAIYHMWRQNVARSGGLLELPRSIRRFPANL